MKIKAITEAWRAATNQYDSERYLDFYHAYAVLDDHSMDRKFLGRAGIKNCFNSYFFGYKTQTRMVDLSHALP